jgi:hypothetical protein
MNPRQLQLTILKSQNTQKPLELKYRKKANEVIVLRAVIPYEVRREKLKDGSWQTYLYGFDISQNIITGSPDATQSIKRWIVRRIIRAKTSRWMKNYVPDFPLIPPDLKVLSTATD